jgi:hypothetical protein
MPASTHWRLLSSALAAGSAAAADLDRTSFDMIVSTGAKSCLPDARAKVTIVSTGTAEDMMIHATGLPANTDFDLFVIQVTLQYRDSHRCARFRAGAGSLQWPIPGCV